MVEQQHLDGRLCEVHEVVVTTNVRQFVREYRLEVYGAKAGQRADGKEDDRP